MPSDFVLKTMNTVHRASLKLSGGRLGWSVRARVASPEERAELWPRVVADHKNYAGYQTKTSREIPLVLLEPQS